MLKIPKNSSKRTRKNHRTPCALKTEPVSPLVRAQIASGWQEYKEGGGMDHVALLKKYGL